MFISNKKMLNQKENCNAWCEIMVQMGEWVTSVRAAK